MYFIFYYSIVDGEYTYIDESTERQIYDYVRAGDFEKIVDFLTITNAPSLLVYKKDDMTWYRINNSQIEFDQARIESETSRIVHDGIYILTKKVNIPPESPLEMVTKENIEGNLGESVDHLSSEKLMFFNQRNLEVQDQYPQGSEEEYSHNIFSRVHELEKLERIKRIGKISKGYLGLHQFSEYIGFRNSEELINFFSKYIIEGINIDWGENLIKFNIPLMMKEIDQIIAFQLDIE